MVPTFNLANHPEIYTRVDEYMRKYKYIGSKLARLCAPNKLAAEGVDMVETYGGQETDRFTGAVIETLKALVNEQGTDILIPIKHRPTGNPVMGDMPLEGKEKVASIGFRAVPVNRSRYAVAKPTGMEAQKVKSWARWITNSCVPDLKEWWAEWYGKSLYHALCYGYSPEIIAGADHGGRGVSMVSPPNMFIAGSGPVTYGGGRPGTAAYEAAVEAAIEGLVGAAGQGFDVAFVRNLVQMAPRCGIKPASYKDGFEFYPIVCTQGQFNQFIKDEEYRELAKSLNITSLAKHPLGNLQIVIFEGAVIIPDIKGWCAYTYATDTDITDGTVAYGPRPTATDIAEGFLVGDTIEHNDEGDVACAHLLGESALTTATAKDLSIEENVKDYKNSHGYGLDVIISTVRNEEYDTIGQITGTAGTFLANQSSLMGLSYSPYALTWEAP